MNGKKVNQKKSRLESRGGKYLLEFILLIIRCILFQEDYKNQVDKYCTARDDFEKKMTLAARHFQEVEGSHLKQMREFVENYCQIVDNNNNQVGRVSPLKGLAQPRAFLFCYFFF